MITLLKNCHVYSPKNLGIKDILIAGNSIQEISDSIDITGSAVSIHDCSDLICIPGLIDSHVHITGGGGSGGYRNRVPEIEVSTLIKAGITTVVGCMGTDGLMRTMKGVLAKCFGLREQGLTSFIYSGSYQVPVQTLTGSIEDDICMIDPVIGVGEIAVSDHRSSNPSFEEFTRIASQARVAGLISGKAGIINVHVGSGRDKLSFLKRSALETEIPATQFLPTHINRNMELVDEGVEWTAIGGFIDLTTSGEKKDSPMKCSRLLKKLLEKGTNESLICFSTDGQGSLPRFNSRMELTGFDIGQVSTLFAEFSDAVKDEGIAIDIALKPVTSNVANVLKLPLKGRLSKGCDADMILLDKDLSIRSVLAMGRKMMWQDQLLVSGVFE